MTTRPLPSTFVEAVPAPSSSNLYALNKPIHTSSQPAAPAPQGSLHMPSRSSPASPTFSSLPGSPLMAAIPSSPLSNSESLAASLNKPKRHQVKNACTNCQKACKKCDNGRPCSRCVRFNLSPCVNSSRKERNRIKKPYIKSQVESTVPSYSSQEEDDWSQTSSTAVVPSKPIKTATKVAQASTNIPQSPPSPTLSTSPSCTPGLSPPLSTSDFSLTLPAPFSPSSLLTAFDPTPGSPLEATLEAFEEQQGISSPLSTFTSVADLNFNNDTLDANGTSIFDDLDVPIASDLLELGNPIMASNQDWQFQPISYVDSITGQMVHAPSSVLAIGPDGQAVGFVIGDGQVIGADGLIIGSVPLPSLAMA